MSQGPNKHNQGLPDNFHMPPMATLDLFDDEEFDPNDPFVVAWRNLNPRRERVPANLGQNFMGGFMPMMTIDIMAPMGGLCPMCAMRAAAPTGGALYGEPAVGDDRGAARQAAQWQEPGVEHHGNQGEHQDYEPDDGTPYVGH